MRCPALLCFLLAAAPLGGCVNTDASIFVDPSVSAPMATVTKQTLGTELNGSFTLALHLGLRAAGASTVSLGAFAIVDAGGDSVPLKVSSATTFPLTMQPGSDVSANFTFTTGTGLLDPSVQTELCAAGMVQIQAAIDDSLAATQAPTTSGDFPVTGCTP